MANLSLSDNVQSSIPNLKWGIHPITKLEINTKNPFVDKSANSYDVIEYTFVSGEKGVYTYRIFNPENPEKIASGELDPEKVKKAIEKAGIEAMYIVSKVTGKLDISADIETFKDVKSFLEANLKPVVIFNEPFKLKLNAEKSLKDGKYYAKITTYTPTEKNPKYGLGWFHKPAEADQTFSNKEKENIAEAERLSSLPLGNSNASNVEDSLPFGAISPSAVNVSSSMNNDDLPY